MKRRILVIDDEANFGQMIKINLEETGNYEVDTALNATAGFEKIRVGQYDTIFLDVLMPKIEGHIALKEIKQLCDTPVVMMSAYIPSQKKQTIVAAGAFACLEKPVALSRILEVLQAIDKRRK